MHNNDETELHNHNQYSLRCALFIRTKLWYIELITKLCLAETTLADLVLMYMQQNP